MVEALGTKEKGSDVKLTTYLLMDGFRKKYQIAVIVSDNSGAAESIKLTI